jgi:predicted AlkP superfamily pyrophosphatase or phosphodiesterase
MKGMFEKIFIIGNILLFLAINIMAQPNSTKAGTTPKLVVGITIEQMRSEYITRYWNTFQEGGFKRLSENGSFTSNTRCDIHNFRTSTGIATIYTGTYPSEHGIVGDQWYKHLTKNKIHAVYDDYYLTLGSDSKNGNASAKMLKVFTLGDVLKEYSNFKSNVFSVALNPIAAVLSAGHSADGAFWYDNSNGKMITSSYYMDKFPDWVRDFNDKLLPDSYLQNNWDLLLPIGSYNTGFEDGYVLEKGFWKKWNTFPYVLPTLSTMLKSKYELLPATPYGNKLIREFAVQLIDQYGLGSDDYPDLLNITFTSMDFANKWFSPASVEIHDTYLRIDQEISSLLNYLDKKVGKENYLVFLTAASTSEYPVGVLKDDMNFNAGEFNPQSAMALLRVYLNAIYGINDWIMMYNEEQVYLNHALIEQKEKPLEEMQEKAALFLNQFEGIKSAVPATFIEKSNLDNPRFKIIENSYCVQRSGDVIILLEEGWRPVPKYDEVDYSSENRIPFILYGTGVDAGTFEEPIDVIDFVPTICKCLRILPPDGAKGKVLKNVFLFNE